MNPAAFLHKSTSPAAPVLDEAALQLRARLDGVLVALADEFGAQARQYPALIAVETLQQAEYTESFPHLLFTAAPLVNPAAPADRLFAAENLAAPSWCLSPAVCLHVYQEWAGRQLDTPLVVTAGGRCFRNEAETAPGARQFEFEMREIVLLGPADWIEEILPELRRRLEQLLQAAEPKGVWASAEDPFFLPAAQGKAYLQRLKETKWEFQTADDDRLALASVNRHGTFFGDRFGLTDGRGEPLHTACLAVGLDRWQARCTTAREENA